MKGQVRQGAASMDAEEGQSVEDRFARLDGHIKKNELKKVIKVADEILAFASEETEARRCKVVALVQLGQHAAALDEIGVTSSLAKDLSFEKGYCLYRLNRLPEALAALQQAERSVGVLQLEAQALYRLGNSTECIQKYEELLGKYKVDSVEVKTNLVAAYVSAGRAKEVPGLMRSLRVAPRDAFDLGYNAACALIECGQLADAAELLQLAQRVGQETLLEEEYTEEDIEDELAPLAVQYAYVLQAQGLRQEALEAYNAILKRKPSDAPAVAVASNNLVVLRGKRDLFDALKRFERMVERRPGAVKFVAELEPKLSWRQREALACNRCLVLLHSHKLDQAREALPALQAAFPKSSKPTLLQAALLLQDKKPAKADELLAAAAGGGSAELAVVRAQALAASGHLDRAADVLAGIASLQHCPATVATLVALKEKIGDVAGAQAVLESAVSWWESHMESAEAVQNREAIVRAAAAFLLQQGKHLAAAAMFQRLVSSSASSATRADAITGLVAATAHYDPAKAEQYESELPPLAGVAGLDAVALERAASTGTATVSSRKAKPAEAASGDLAGQKKAKKRKRTVRYPKGFDPANPGPLPDPERWLPRRERSTFKKRGKKKEVNTRGAQGAAVKEPAAAPAPAEPAPEAKPAGGGGNKNKKKKGKK